MKKLLLVFLICCGANANDVIVVDAATAAQNKRISRMMPKKLDHHHNYTQTRSHGARKGRYSSSRYGKDHHGPGKPTQARSYRSRN